MLHSLKAGLAALVVLAAAAGAANAFTPAFDPAVGDLQVGGSGPAKATKVQLGIQSPADGVCPGAAKVSAWVFTNKPGTINIMLVNKKGGVYGPYPVKTAKGSGGVVMGSLNTGFMIDAPTDTKYRIVIANSDVVSNWVPLTACI